MLHAPRSMLFRHKLEAIRIIPLLRLIEIESAQPALLRPGRGDRGMETFQEWYGRGSAHVGQQAGQLERGAAVGPPHVVLFAASESPGPSARARLEARVGESDLAARRRLAILLRRRSRGNVVALGDPEVDPALASWRLITSPCRAG